MLWVGFATHLQVRGEVTPLDGKGLLLGARRVRGGGESKRGEEGCVWDSSVCADGKKGEPRRFNTLQCIWSHLK